MTGITSLIQHLGGKDILIESLTSLTHQAEEEALRQHSDTLQTETRPEILDKPKGKEISKQKTPIDPIPPPDKPKTALKAGKLFFPVFANSTLPRHDKDADNGEDEDDNKPGIYSKILNGAGDGTHYITASFVKNNDKIKDQLLSYFKYFAHVCKFRRAKHSPGERKKSSRF
jgi:hypothetical protein